MKANTVRWNELSLEEQKALEIMGSGPYLMMPVAVAERLEKLGLVDQKLGAPGLNDAGRMLLLRRL